MSGKSRIFLDIVKDCIRKFLPLADEIGTKQVVVKIRAGEGGKVFGSVSSKEIAAAAKEQVGLELDKKKIQLSDPIKTFGVHDVTIKLHPQVTANLKVKVEEA